ncbi:DEAD/DEAH box helicase [Streptococcus pneumoniae]|uniref:DEAD/DEAH box helicase n=1 Tax=Streptococcus pneumoniae TaxID=1313 RepID=UPI00076991E8|nr:DEAD/DEAH box helicase [Streptococcus pneumoniae]VNR20200.1 putative SNF-family helicase [Streptococcus pneumoniae]
MAKLIPGKVRIEGVALYETGKVDIIKEKNNRLYARVAEEELRYSLEDDLVFCACDFFQKRGYCVHLAALEHFLKNDERGQEILWSLEEGHEEKEAVETKVTLGGKFLDRILSPKSECAYELSAVGQVEAGTNHILWTLRIGQINSQKYYVIRDIPLFLRIVEQRKSYMIGKIYEESLSWEAFDDASQELLTFLHGLTEEGLVSDLFFQNQGRHLFFPLTFFEQGVNLLMALPHFQFDHQVDSYQTLLFQDMHADANLFAFTVTEYSDYFEMEISESPRVNVFYQGAVLFHKGQVYFLTDQQMRLLKEIKALPVGQQGKKYLQFDSSDRDKLASCLTLFIQMGTVSAPERLQIKTFAPSFYFFDEETKKIRQNLQELGQFELKDGTLQARKSLAYSLAHLFEGRDRVSFSQEFQNLAQDLTHPEDFPRQATQVQADLRDYQEKGIGWLQMLHHYGFGGILADDMGLGKTLQTIAFLTSQVTKESRVLILAPSGLIYNWADEFQKFAPQLDVAVVHGLKASREEILAESHQIYVTSYATFRQDSEFYQGMAFDFLFLDEAQVMKNAQTKIAQTLRQFVVPSVFALSGTPIENHLGELWSIFQIVMPGLLPSKKEFMKLPAERVAQFIKPFVMRRKKEEVLTELPDLIEVVYKNELEDQQKAIYLAQLQQMRDHLAQVSEQEFQRSRVEILSGLMRLRQICDTPALFMEDYQGASGKLDSLRDLLVQVADGGHRVLIFSQFKGMLEKIEQELPDLGLTSFKITGSTPAKERQDMTKAFNQGERDAFLISLKAGGVGLNLTGADTVILVDLWWNPAVEAQAIGRAHRMGQEETVEVYRLVTKGTIEEKIQELQEQKKHLVSQVLDGTESRGSLTLAEIREILGISEAST